MCWALTFKDRVAFCRRRMAGPCTERKQCHGAQQQEDTSLSEETGGAWRARWARGPQRPLRWPEASGSHSEVPGSHSHRGPQSSDSSGQWGWELGQETFLLSFCSSPTVTTHPHTHTLHTNTLRTHTTHVHTALTCTHTYTHRTQTPTHATHAHLLCPHTAHTHPNHTSTHCTHTFTQTHIYTYYIHMLTPHSVPTRHFHTSHTYTQHPQSPAPTALTHTYACPAPRTLYHTGVVPPVNVGR